MLQSDGYTDLLGTIKIPRNLKLLSERLPKSNFGDKQRSRSIGKRDNSTSSSFEKSASTSAMTNSDPAGSYPSQ